MSTLEPSALKATLSDKILRYNQTQVRVYTTGGEVFVYFDNSEFQTVHGQSPLDLDLRQRLEDEAAIHQVLFKPTENKQNALSLSIIKKIVGVQDRTVGYLEATLSVDTRYIDRLTKAMGAELVFFDEQGNILLGSLPSSVSQMDLGSKLLEGQNSFFEFSIGDVPYAFMSTGISWGERAFLIGMGSSKEKAEGSIRKVNYVIIFTFLSFLVFLILMSVYFVREVISPIEALIKASRELKDAREAPFIPNHSKTEIAELVDAFNEMSVQIVESDQKMKGQLELLEQANTKIKSTQNQLVQSAKLASLGELVAGIAHELNNPIGFIYSNISHLREYSQALFSIIDKSRINKNELDLLVVEQDYEYIKKDFPKLIQSCEEGSHRAKEIVIGLRNFSRADEEKTQAFDVNKGIDSTLKLLAGEIKNKIKLVKDYHELPMVNCNVNQMKQVFMNILSNAAQAISDEGEIKIKTHYKSEAKRVRIEISDTGSGIEKENIEKIFDPFYTTKSVGQGTGLGLSISYGIVKSHGGTIEVSSKVGVGTAFTTDFPVYRE